MTSKRSDRRPRMVLDNDRLRGAINLAISQWNVSLKQIAIACGISSATVSRICSPDYKRSPDVDTFASLVDWLGGGADRFLVRNDGG